MSLDHILLGLLREPASGYDLKTKIDQGIGHFWAAELSQIYPTLKRLEKDGLLTSRKAASERGAGRLLYETTEAGREVLAAWLRGGPQVGDLRLAYLAQLFLMDEVGSLDETLRFLNQLRSRLDARLQGVKTVEREWAECNSGFPANLDEAGFHHYLTLRMGLLTLAAQVRWCDESIRMVGTRIAAHRNKRNQDKTQAHKRKSTRPRKVTASAAGKLVETL